jgi:D-sedoheptulose 7-phosphate isomerase
MESDPATATATEPIREMDVLWITAGLGCDRGLADIPIVVHSDYIPRIQEAQASVHHVMREIFEVIARGQA